jgi:hypothetical protein
MIGTLHLALQTLHGTLHTARVWAFYYLFNNTLDIFKNHTFSFRVNVGQFIVL